MIFDTNKRTRNIICTFIIKNILFFVLFIILKNIFLSSAIHFFITVTNSYLKQSTQKQEKFILTCDYKSFILQAAWHAAAFEPLLYLHNMAGNAEEWRENEWDRVPALSLRARPQDLQPSYIKIFSFLKSPET